MTFDKKNRFSKTQEIWLRKVNLVEEAKVLENIK